MPEGDAGVRSGPLAPNRDHRAGHAVPPEELVEGGDRLLGDHDRAAAHPPPALLLEEPLPLARVPLPAGPLGLPVALDEEVDITVLLGGSLGGRAEEDE